MKMEIRKIIHIWKRVINNELTCVQSLPSVFGKWKIQPYFKRIGSIINNAKIRDLCAVIHEEKKECENRATRHWHCACDKG